jgi:hypothetical protein
LPLFLLFEDTAKIAPAAKRYPYLVALLGDVAYLIEYHPRRFLGEDGTYAHKDLDFHDF